MSRLLIVSNRLPVSVVKRDDGFEYHRSHGGLATGLGSLPDRIEKHWVGWCGLNSDRLSAEDKTRISDKLLKKNCSSVFLTKKQVENYYHGFSNETIWPLFHYFPVQTIYEDQFWKFYKLVNRLFCERVLETARPDDVVWVQDYHLMLLPQMLREKMPSLQIGYFLHIPFPSFELFRLLPWRNEILHGLLGADLIGFHTYDYVRHFLSSVCRLAGTEHYLGKLSIDDRVVKVDAFPMGINYRLYSTAPTTHNVKNEIESIRSEVGDRKIVISIDRLDYTKGILHRLEAFDLFLSEKPEYRGQVTMIMVAVPSRTRVEHYKQLRDQLEQLIGRVNGEYGSIGYMPVWYFYRAVPFDRLLGLYAAADVALVTPIRDGMNLIAKEFVAAKTNSKHGVLILSEMAGAASELGESLMVNANNKHEIVKAIKTALEMPEDEQARRLNPMQQRLERYTVTRWASDFIEAIEQVQKTQHELTVQRLDKAARAQIIEDYQKSKKRLLLLDYDGTLVGFSVKPEQAGPDDTVLTILKKLSADPNNRLVVISGRDHQTLQNWLGGLDATLVAEHGAAFREADGQWKFPENHHSDWKADILPVLELYADRTPGAFVEEKKYSLVWHCRRAQPEQGYIRLQELRDALMNLTANLGVGVFEGNKILEVKDLSISKGIAAEKLLKDHSADFILAAGDDYTDEQMFEVLPQEAYSVKIGMNMSRARYRVDNVKQFRSLLNHLSGGS